MSKGIKGKDIDKVKRVDSCAVDVIMKNGNIIRFTAYMCDYDDCELRSDFIDSRLGKHVYHYEY